MVPSRVLFVWRTLLQDRILAIQELRPIFSWEVTYHVAATHSMKFLEIRYTNTHTHTHTHTHTKRESTSCLFHNCNSLQQQFDYGRGGWREA